MSLYDRIMEAVTVKARKRSRGNIRTMHPGARPPARRPLKVKAKEKPKAKPCPRGFVRAFGNPDAPCLKPKIKVRRR